MSDLVDIDAKIKDLKLEFHYQYQLKSKIFWDAKFAFSQLQLSWEISSIIA